MDRSYNAHAYIGDELDVFALAVNWKQYWGQMIRPYLGNSILEVGAGIGGTTNILYETTYDHWVALEPDKQMVADLHERQENSEFSSSIEFREGTIEDLAVDELFDSIIYIDVLEHIEDDKKEISLAAKHLKPNGFLIVLSPAYQFLFTEFDAAIGHYRRYRSHMLENLTPSTLNFYHSYYLDSVGLLTSIMNRLFLHSSKPTHQQIIFWDRVMVRLSRYIVDPLVRFSFGRSVVGIWQKPHDDDIPDEGRLE